MTLCWLGKLIKKENKKSICFVRETIPNIKNKLIFKYINKCFEKYFDKIFFISEYDKKIFSTIEEKSIVIKNTVKDDFFHELDKKECCKKINIKENNFNLLFVGGINKLKGTHVILKSLKYLPKDVNLIIAGYSLDEKKIKFRNFYERKILKLLKSKDINTKIKFIGVQKNMKPIYYACDALVFPATKAHQARPAFEAGACGKPIILSEFVQIYEIIENYKNGLLFKKNNSKDLANKIIMVYEDRDLCNKLGIENKTMTLNNHSIKFIKNKLLNETEKIFNKD